MGIFLLGRAIIFLALMEFLFRKLNGRSEIKDAKKLYREAFPKRVRVPFIELLVLERGDGASFWGLFDKNRALSAIAYTVEIDSALFLYYLAVDEKMRGKSLGTSILRSLKTISGNKRLYLSVDGKDDGRPEDRIIDFYLKSGIRRIGLSLYDKTGEYPLLSFGGEYDESEINRLMERVYIFSHFSIGPSSDKSSSIDK